MYITSNNSTGDQEVTFNYDILMILLYFQVKYYILSLQGLINLSKEFHERDQKLVYVNMADSVRRVVMDSGGASSGLNIASYPNRLTLSNLSGQGNVAYG